MKYKSKRLKRQNSSLLRRNMKRLIFPTFLNNGEQKLWAKHLRQVIPNNISEHLICIRLGFKNDK